MTIDPVYSTKLGSLYTGDSAILLTHPQFSHIKGKVQLIFTSPPFPLARKKKYGNLNGEAYEKWLGSFGELFSNLLTDQGSLVIELGNAWKPKLPVMSLTPIKSLMKLKEEGNFELCQEFIWYNPAKLPTPAQWVNVERIRVKDAFTRFWWLSKTARPEADNRRILTKYSKSMTQLLLKKNYNSGKRPSEHRIGEKSFLKNNNGSIPSNVLSISNTNSRSSYLNYCRKKGIIPNPSRMPPKLAKFFIEFLTNDGDLVLDPFAGSNVTGYVAEKLNRKWISIELKKDFAISSKYRFDMFRKHDGILKGDSSN